MIDVMLVLLVIVLTTASFVTKSALNVDLPRSSTQEGTASAKTHEITITKSGAFYLGAEQISAQGLAQFVKAAPKSDVFVIKADVGSGFGKFVEVVDLLKLAGVENVAIATLKAN